MKQKRNHLFLWQSFRKSFVSFSFVKPRAMFDNGDDDDDNGPSFGKLLLSLSLSLFGSSDQPSSVHCLLSVIWGVQVFNNEDILLLPTLTVNRRANKELL